MADEKPQNKKREGSIELSLQLLQMGLRLLTLSLWIAEEEDKNMVTTASTWEWTAKSIVAKKGKSKETKMRKVKSTKAVNG